jgi:NAD(P)-dependent dehydrogenase (short-subunit alcohol dehydrogenase family)
LVRLAGPPRSAARNPDLGQAAESKLQGEKFDAHFVELDLINPQTVSLAASKVQRQFGRLDVLVNIAGIVDSRDSWPSLASTMPWNE